MTIQVNDVIRMVISYAAPEASVAMNVFYFICKVASIDDEDGFTDLEDHLVATWLSAWDNVAADSAEAFLIEGDVMNLDGTVDRQLASVGITKPGLSAGSVLPAGVSAFIQADSEDNKAKGRKYIPFFTELDIIDGDFNAALLVLLAQMFVDYVTTVDATGTTEFVPGVLSRPHETFYDFNGNGYIVSTPAYQRRRKPNVGS